MTRKLFFLLLLYWAWPAAAQNPASVFQLTDKTMTVPCGATCTSFTVSVPHIRQSGDYTVQTIPYRPFAWADGGTELTALYSDDIYSSVISLPYPVCFYGATYNSLVVGSNGLLSFDVTNAGRRNNFRQTVSFSNTTPVLLPYAAGNQNSLASTYYPKAAIMGVYHDIFPYDNGSRRIEWRMEGTAPKRRFIASFRDVPMYSCTSLSATHQIVVYESTGVVEVYIKDKPVCTAWNEGLAILGMQNASRDKAIFPAGKNTGRWGSMGMNEAYRFIPSAGLSRYKKAELIYGSAVLATADTSTAANGNLNLHFNQVCPAADSSSYILRVTYQSCGSVGEVSFDDTVVIKKERLEVQLETANATCLSGGSIRVRATGTTSGLHYSLNGGAPQSSPHFTQLPAGKYTMTVAGDGTCTKTVEATITLEDDLLLVAPPTATVCAGETFTPQILSNASSFSWSPSTGISNTAEAHPQITVTTNAHLTLTAVKGVCRKTTELDVVVKPLPVVSAGADQTVILGDAVTLAATASAGNLSWTPTNGLQVPTDLNPVATPQQTTTYELSVSNNGCTATDDVTITVVPYCVKPAEAFTPNGDGTNDLWLVTTGACLKQARVEVFNRYGGPVYQSANYQNNWNGTFNGKPLPDGTYYYIITYHLINGKAVSLKGPVTILR
jgi:gliding motility-associated-like protein